MDQKIKIVVMALILLLGVSFFLSFNSYSAKQMAERERDSLRADNDSLAKKAGDASQQAQGLQNRINSLNSDLDSVSKAKDDLQKQLEQANQDRSDLSEQIKKLRAEKAAQASQPAVSSVSTQEMAPQGTSDDAYWAAILKQKTDLEMQIQGVRQDIRGLQQTNAQLQKEKNNLELEVGNLIRERADLKHQLDYNQKVMDSVAKDLVREKNEKFQTQDDAKTVKEENLFLRRQIKAMNNRQLVLENRLAEWQDKNNSLTAKVAELEATLKDKMLEVSNLKHETETKKIAKASEKSSAPTGMSEKEAVELPTIVVKPQASAGQDIQGSIGRVVAVNRDNNFIIVDVGEETGIGAGNILTVFRQGSPIADVQVIQTRKNISACDIKKEITPIKIGDTLQYKH